MVNNGYIIPCIRKDLRHILQQCTCGGVRTFSTSRGKSHYDVLGITPSATQADIKSAYYKLSMKYHPDKCTEEGAKGKFRDITEAYEILGNVRLKKFYDKGLLSQSRSERRYEPPREPDDPVTKFYKSHAKRQRVPVMRDGKTPVYDFDAWTRNHYTETFERKAYDKFRVKTKQETKIREKEGNRAELAFFIAIFTSMFIFISLAPENYDVDKTKKSR